MVTGPVVVTAAVGTARVANTGPNDVFVSTIPFSLLENLTPAAPVFLGGFGGTGSMSAIFY